MREEKMSKSDFKKAQRVSTALDNDLKNYLKGKNFEEVFIDIIGAKGEENA